MSRDRLYNLFEKIEKKPEKAGFLSFLVEYRQRLKDFLDSKVTEKYISELAGHFFVAEEDFSDALENFDKRTLELRNAMDITHPDWSDEKRKKYIKELIKLADKIIKENY